jgi:hypothetical protein
MKSCRTSLTFQTPALHPSLRCPDDREGTHLWNVGQLRGHPDDSVCARLWIVGKPLRDCTVQYARRESSSHFMSWKLEFSLRNLVIFIKHRFTTVFITQCCCWLFRPTWICTLQRVTIYNTVKINPQIKKFYIFGTNHEPVKSNRHHNQLISRYAINVSSS